VIDEVHMLTTDASNTLLKTLEEPPDHVVFVLATTEPGKVLPTIRSRTQHFEFTLLSHPQLVGHLADVLQREGIESDPDALDLIARRAAGSARDALSALDQALALGGGRLDRAQVEASFGDTGFGQRVAVLEAIAAEDPAGALVAVQTALTAGTDPRRLAEDILRTLRDAFVLANAGDRVPYDGPAEEAERLRTLATGVGNAPLVRGIETLGQAIVDIRGPATPDPRLVLEVAVVRLARRDARASIDALADRVERLVKQLASGAAAPAAPANTAPAPAPAPAPTVDEAPPPRALDEPPEAAPPAHAAADVTYDLDAVIEAWPLALESLKAPLRATIQDAHPIGMENGTIVFGVPRKRLDAINQRFRSEADAIKGAFAQHLGAQPKFILRPHDFDAADAFRPAAGDVAPPPVPVAAIDATVEEVEEEIVDLSETVAARDTEVDPLTQRLLDDFGGEVVEEQPRD
jgi:DNA polymerase III gamma/tau subunit